MEKSYPAYRTNKNIDNRFAPQLGVIQCAYNHLVRTFGQPTLSADNNDTFDGTEQCAWLIEFENGNMVTVSEEKGFGDREHDYKKSDTWKINSRSPHTYEWIKQAIRDSNPNG